MSIPSTGVRVSASRNEVGGTTSEVGDLVGASNINIFSRYAPGTVETDASKNLILTPDTPYFKLGDYRLYDHTAPAPIWWQNTTQYWAPGGSTTDVTLLIAMNQLNLAYITGSSDVIDSTGSPWQYRFKIVAYGSSANRIAEASPLKSWTFTIDMVNSGFTVLSGHTRDMTGKYIMNTGYSGNIFLCDAVPVTSPSCTRYFDGYFCDIAGNRKINIGTTISAGYVDVELIENNTPVANTQYSGSPDVVGTGYTAIFPQVYISATPICSCTSNIDQSIGSTYAFYVFAKGIYALETRIVAIASTDIILTLDGVETTLATGVALSHTSGYLCSGSLAPGSAWNYNDIGIVTFRNATLAASPAYTKCF